MKASTTADASRTDCAVVLAAGAGSRLRSTLPNGDGSAKPLVPVLGVPIIVRSLLTLRGQGVREVVIVTGYAEDAVRRGLTHDPRVARLRITFAHNDDWRMQNGVSVLAARDAIGDRPFFLVMGDHLYEGALLSLLRAAPPAAGQLSLAVDYRVGEVHDLDDAVKVRVGPGERIVRLGKRLHEFDAVDTGVFLATPALFDALDTRRSHQNGDCSLVDGVGQLADEGSARAVDIHGSWWQDIDDYDSLRLAEHALGRLRAAPELQRAL